MSSPQPSDHERTVQVRNRLGLHARPAAEFVRAAKRYHSEIVLRKDDVEVNGKSIMGVLMLAAEYGSRLTIRAEGADAREAVDGLSILLEKSYEEE